MPKLRILSPGEVIYSWTVLQLLPKRYYSCKCKCGNISEIRAHDLLSGKSKSCRSCQLSIAKRTHNQVSTPEYTSWSKMVSRCTNPKDKDYKNYGERGITVCDEWLESFEAFLMSMGPAPKGYTIDRKDVNKNYTIDNCKWSSVEEQNKNKRNNINITYNNQTKVLSEWIQELGITNGNTYYKKISKSRMKIDQDYNTMFSEWLKNGAKYE